MGRGAGRKIVQNALLHGKRHDNKILKVNILLSRNFVVVEQAPRKSFAILSLQVSRDMKSIAAGPLSPFVCSLACGCCRSPKLCVHS